MSRGDSPNPLSFGIQGTDDLPVLLPALYEALARLRAATCLVLDVSLDAHHLIQLVPPEDMGGRSGWTTGSWDAANIKLSRSLTAAQVCPVLLHEMVHVLRRSNSHPGPNGSFSYSVVHVSSQPVTKITGFDVEAICAVQSCGCQVPE